MTLTDPHGVPYQMTIRQMCMTEILIGNKPCINAFVQISINNDKHYFVCKNEHEYQTYWLPDDYTGCLGDHFDNPETVVMITHGALVGCSYLTVSMTT